MVVILRRLSISELVRARLPMFCAYEAVMLLFPVGLELFCDMIWFSVSPTNISLGKQGISTFLSGRRRAKPRENNKSINDGFD